jgi:hypothetical protein
MGIDQFALNPIHYGITNWQQLIDLRFGMIIIMDLLHQGIKLKQHHEMMFMQIIWG